VIGPRFWVGVLLGGVAVGIGGRAIAYGPDPGSLISGLAAPWLLASAAAGYAAGRGAEGALAGAALLCTAVVAYYAVRYRVDGAARHYAASMTVLWGFFGTLLGAVFGLAGAALRRAGSMGHLTAVALLAGTLFGEGVLYLMLTRGQEEERLLLTGQVAVAGALPFALLQTARLRASAVALAGAIAAGALVVDAAVRVFAKAKGWGA
jgi:hypothetical protein